MDEMANVLDRSRGEFFSSSCSARQWQTSIESKPDVKANFACDVDRFLSTS